jgi:thiosulfate/3-mercaptopyruvate sulfurtransferase
MTDRAAVAGPSRSSLLINVDELRAALVRPDAPILIDVRWIISGSQPEAFADGHVPGARFVDLETELSDPSITPDVAGRHPLPSANAFTATVRSWGVTATTPIVAMDDFSSVGAARAWWLLRYFGHQHVRVLDGGWKAWVSAGGSVEVGPGDRADRTVSDAAAFEAVAGGMPTIGIDDVDNWVADRVLLDARPAERFRGEVEPMDPVPGHIPGATSLPTFSLVDDTGRFRSDAELRALLDAAGVGVDATIATSCGSGVTAAHTSLALALLGIDTTVFPGSYSQWSRTPGRPIATGA